MCDHTQTILTFFSFASAPGDVCLVLLGAGFGGTCPFAAGDPVCVRTGRGGGLNGAGLAGTTLEFCT